MAHVCTSLAVLGDTVGTKAGEWTGYMQRTGQVGSDLAKVPGSCFVSRPQSMLYKLLIQML